jgi:hypothetical protein
MLACIIATLMVATGSGLIVHTAKSQDGERALYFSVATKSSTDTPSDFITIFGSGTFDNQGGVDANGIWSIQTLPPPPTTLNKISSGTWVATGVMSFVSYGVVNTRAEGGQVALKVTFQYDNGPVLNGITLIMTCHIGQPPAGTAEGVTLSGPINFDIPLAGITVFGQPPE